MIAIASARLSTPHRPSMHTHRTNHSCRPYASTHGLQAQLRIITMHTPRILQVLLFRKQYQQVIWSYGDQQYLQSRLPVSCPCLGLVHQPCHLCGLPWKA